MGFTDKIRDLCGGSRALTWLITVTVASGLLLWLVTLADYLAGGHMNPAAAWLALPADPAAFITRPWTLATYMLTHTSPLHLLFNTLWLYWFGRLYTDAAPDRTLIRLFVCSGVAGGLLYILCSWLGGNTSGAYLTGDSAAVLGVMTATAVLMPDRRIGLFLIGEIRLIWVAAACILLTLLSSGGGTGLAAQGAHIGGVLCGAISGCARRGLIRLPRPRKARRRVNAQATLRAINSRIPDNERLDQLLDKIRVSGYESLSSKEKTELNHISSRIEE